VLGFLGASHFGLTLDMIDLKTSAFLAAGYLAVGVLWSFAKWYFKLSNVRDTFLELKAKFIKDHKLPDTFPTAAMPESAVQSKDDKILREEQVSLLKEYVNAIERKMMTYESISSRDYVVDPSIIGQSIKPSAVRHKSSITQWIAFWPISFVWTMINDPVRKVVNWIFSRIKGTFQRMSDAMFAGV
jgi:hypothetical protein